MNPFPGTESAPAGGDRPAGGSASPQSLLPTLRKLRPGDRESLANFRHALRTPLNQIIGYCEMLMETTEELNATELLPELKRIHTSGGQLLSLITDSLAPWKVESMAIDFSILRRDIRPPLSGVIDNTEICLQAAATAGQPTLLSDLRKIRQAAQNLSELFESEDFPAKMNFARTEAAGTPPLPVDLLSPGGSIAPTPMAEGLTGARLLVVEDDPMNRDMLCRRLQRLGHVITEAENGRVALKRLREQPFDLVLLDLLMPEMDGIQTLEAMKSDARTRHLPVIMLTAMDDVESTVRCLDAGADDFVPKPFNPVILRARISASLEKKRLRDKEQAYLAQLQSERAKSERLLLNVLPKAIADRLKHGERTIVDSIPDATVMFADLVGFSKFASNNTPDRTVQLLNEIFSSFDRIAEQHELEKIKTIGDSYMLVGGVPTSRTDHAEICALSGLEMLGAIAAFNKRNQLDWKIRIGINTGPVVAGIIGTQKFSYDLWGDTVNIASRLEANGQPGRIQVSEATMRLLEGKFLLESVGLINLKNVGPVHAYLVLGLK